MSAPTTTPASDSNGAAPASSAPWAKQSGSAGTPWGKGSQANKSRATERLRRTIDGLPAWEPTPPGEIAVQRGQRDA